MPIQLNINVTKLLYNKLFKLQDKFLSVYCYKLF